MPLRRRPLPAVLLLLGLLASACGGGTASTVGTGDARPQLVDEFPTLAGETIDLESLQGQDVVLWFWAPW